MTRQDLERQRQAKHRLTAIRHAREVSGNVSATCRYYGINQPLLQVAAPPRGRGLGRVSGPFQRPAPHAHRQHTGGGGVEVLRLRRQSHFGPEKIAMHLQRYRAARGSAVRRAPYKPRRTREAPPVPPLAESVISVVELLQVRSHRIPHAEYVTRFRTTPFLGDRPSHQARLRSPIRWDWLQTRLRSRHPEEATGTPRTHQSPFCSRPHSAISDPVEI